MRRIFPRHSDTTMKLDALLRSMNRDAAAECLGHRRCDRRIFVAACIGVRRISCCRSRRADFEPEIGEAVLDRLVRTDRPAELLALLHITRESFRGTTELQRTVRTPAVRFRRATLPQPLAPRCRCRHGNEERPRELDVRQSARHVQGQNRRDGSVGDPNGMQAPDRSHRQPEQQETSDSATPATGRDAADGVHSPLP